MSDDMTVHKALCNLMAVVARTGALADIEIKVERERDLHLIANAIEVESRGAIYGARPVSWGSLHYLGVPFIVKAKP